MGASKAISATQMLSESETAKSESWVSVLEDTETHCKLQSRVSSVTAITPKTTEAIWKHRPCTQRQLLAFS